MKIKLDFVTNSSSASFMIPKSCLNEGQIGLIYDHIEVACALALIRKATGKITIYLDPWIIEDHEEFIEGHTSMDNFDMEWFLKQIGVNLEDANFEGSNY